MPNSSNDLVSLVMLPPDEREPIREHLLASDPSGTIAAAEAALARTPPAPDGIDQEAFQYVLEGEAVHLLTRAGPRGVDALLRALASAPASCLVCALGRIAHAAADERERACAAIAAALPRIDPATIVADDQLFGLLQAAEIDGRVEAAVDALVRDRIDLGVHVLRTWASLVGRAPILRHEAALLEVIRSGMQMKRVGDALLFAVGMRARVDDPPVYGELVAAELLLCLDYGHSEARTWLEGCRERHPDPSLAAHAAALLGAYRTP